MVINDKLKGEFYRAPLTKLASRNNVLTTLNELIEYFNKLSELIDSNFQKITDTRNAMKVNLLTIYERTKHFKYVLDHFKIDVDSHITERLNDAIENFQNKITTFVTPYEANLFNHSCVTDDVISNKVDTNAVEDWDRSINMLASELGIRWFGGKISDKSLITELDNILHITKVNTYEGFTNEDYINSNLILDIFLYTSKGITWLSLGKNGDFGYNIIVKYQSKESPFKLKVLSETYNNRKEFDINTYDFDMILNTLLSRSDIKNGNVYIKVKTNIPSNTESGREGYFLTSSKKFNDHEVKKGISEFARGLMYHDNKDVAYFEHADDNIYDIKQKTSEKTETNSILNARSDELKDFETDSKEKQFYSEISNIGEEKYVQSIYNPDEVKMNELMDIVSGFIISNTDTEVKKNYLEGVKLNKKYDNGDPVKYTKGETVVDISDPSFVGDLSLMAKNENMFAVENSFSKSKVVPSQFKYGTEISSETVENTFTNDESFTDINDNSYTQDADILLTPIVEHNSIIYKVVKVTDYDILILKSDGIYRFNSRDKLSGDSFTEKINQNNLFNVCYDAVVNGKIVYLATDVGVCKMNTQSFVVERTGVVGGSWCKLFETFDKTNVIAIRKDFSTNLDNGRISYGESVAMTNGGNFNTLKVIFQDNKYFTYDNPALDNELTKVERALDYTNKRNFQEEFKVLHNPIENRYYFFRYGHKMLYTDNPNDPSMKFANFKIVSAMKDYDISDALIFENKIYFTVYEGGNYYYDLNTNTVHPVEYTTTKVINNRNTTYKSYYMSKLSNLVNDNADSTGIVNKYVLLTPEELAAGYVEGTKYFYPSIKTLHLCSVEEKMNGPDPNIDYYGCIGTTFGVIGSWFIGKVTSFNNIDKHGVYNPDMNYGYVEFANDGKYLDYTLAVATEGFMMDPSKIHKLVHVEEELPKINCFLKVANGKLFFIPNNPDNEIRNLVYVNGYYYFATNQDYIFKLDENFNIINQIRSEDCNEILGAGNLLVIQNNSVTSEEITKSEAYYDKVDGSEMIEGYNPDVEYYLEKEITETYDTYENLSQEEYDNGPQNDVVYYKKISDTEYEPYSDDELKNPISFTELGPYPLTLDAIDPNKQYASYDNDSGDYILIETSELLDSTIDIADFQEGFGLYEVNPQTFKVEKEEIYKLIEGGGSETRKEMTRANVNNPDDFALTPKYNAIDSETRAQGIQDGVEYYVSRELPDKEYYDHIEPEAKTVGYDSLNFNPSEYFIGDLIEFSSVPVEEREGKPLYAANAEGTNYVLVDYYREGTTVIDDINNFYTVANTYTPCADDDFNLGFDFVKVNKDETPNPVDGVGYYIKLDQPDPDTGIPYADAGIGGETLYAFDITKDYYVPYRLLYHFKNDNTFGYQKTYFHKRIEDSGVEYIKAEKENGDFKVTDTYTPLTPEEKEERPQKGVDYYIHPTVMKDVFTKLLDKSSGKQPGVEYYKMNGTPTESYVPLTQEEINNGPQEGEVYYIFDGGIWIEKPYDSLEDGADNNKIFSDGYTYNKKVYDYSGVEYVLCTDEDFINTLYTQVNIDEATVTPDTVGNFYIHRQNRYEQADEDDFDKVNIQFSETADTTPNIDKINDGKYFVCYGDTSNNDDYTAISLKDLVDDPDAHLIVTKYESNVFDYYTTDENGDEILASTDNGYLLNPEPGVTTFVEGKEYYLKKNFDPDTTYYESTYDLAFRTIDSWIGVYYTQNPDGKENDFKPDMDYYTKSQVGEINTNEYVKATFGSKLVHTITRGDSLIKGRDIYSGKNYTYLKTKTETGMNMYRFEEGTDEPVLLFSVNVGGDSRLEYTNGKLFAFDDGLIIDYLKNEQQTWAPITLLPGDQTVNKVYMFGDNLFLSKQITEDGPNKDKYEIYYYDYSTRSLKKCTEIEPTINSPTFYDNIDACSNVDSDTTIISIDYTSSETTHQSNEVYIFNKKFNKIEGTLNQYTSTYRYSGFKGVSDDDVIDCTEKDFIKINGFTSLDRLNRYIDLIESNDGVSSGCLVLHVVSSDSQQNGKSVFYTVNNSNQLIMLPKEYSSMTDSSVDSTILSFAYKDENNRCFFVYTNATRKSIDFVYYDNPNENDLIDTQNLQLIYSFDYNGDNPTADDLDPSSTLDLLCSAIYYIEKITKENNDYIRFFAKFIDNETDKERYALFNLNISGQLTNDRSILKYGIDSFDEDKKLSNLYTSVRFEKNLISLNDDGNYSYRDFNYKLNNFDKELYYVEETSTLNSNFLMLVKEDDDRIQIYKYENGIISPTENYVGPFDNSQYFIIARTSDNLDDFIIIVDDIYMMKLGGEFDPDKDYFLKETTYDFFPDIPYFLKSMMVNFKLELEYFTKRIRTIIQDVISHARSYTSTDKTSKLFHKSLIKIKDNSLKVLMNVLSK